MNHIGRASKRMSLFLVIGLGVTCLVTGCTGVSRETAVSTRNAFIFVPAQKRGEPVRLQGTALSDENVDTLTMRGSAIVINVWGSWCPPCRKEAPEMQAAYKQTPRSAVNFVGIDTRDNNASAQKYEKEFKIEYLSIEDTGTTILQLRGALTPASIPSTLLLDKSGRPAALFSGPITNISMRQAITQVNA